MKPSEHRALMEILIVVGSLAALLGAVLATFSHYELHRFNKATEGAGYQAVLLTKRHEYVEKPIAKYAPNNRYYMDFVYSDEDGRKEYVTKGWTGLSKRTFDKYQEGDEIIIYVIDRSTNDVVIASEKEADRAFLRSNLWLSLGFLGVGVFLLLTVVYLRSASFVKRYVVD